MFDIRTLNFVLSVFFIHFIFDFAFQSRRMAEGKSKEWGPLIDHVLVYSIGLSILAILWRLSFPNLGTALAFVGINGVVHFIQDRASSQITSSLYEKKNYYGFFTTIGFDQLLHYATLFISFYLLTTPS